MSCFETGRQVFLTLGLMMMSNSGYLARGIAVALTMSFALSAQATIVDTGSETEQGDTGNLMFLSCGSLTKSEDSCQMPEYSIMLIDGPGMEDEMPEARVPEPGSLALLALGLIGYGVSRRRR